MGNQIRIHNLKSIKEFEMDCAKVNLLVGTNSSGKSTIIQAILVAAQNMLKQVGVNGELTSLGRYEDIKCIYSSGRDVQISISWDNTEIKYVYTRDSNTLKPVFIKIVKQNKDYIKQFDLEKRMFQYLSCHRIGPQKTYAKNLSLVDTIGINGEYAISYLNKKGITPLDLNLCKDENDYTLLGQVNWWLSYIMNTTIATEEIGDADIVLATYSSGDLLKIRPDNIGAGISYLISILIMCLSAPKDGIIVIENPEIHLHPLAQSRVCEFLYFIACSGRHLFIETHSDHIFNGFRAGIATGEMNKEDINIQFVYLNREHITESIKVDIGKFGNINNQVDNLFDQFDIDLNRMLGI